MKDIKNKKCLKVKIPNDFFGETFCFISNKLLKVGEMVFFVSGNGFCSIEEGKNIGLVVCSISSGGVRNCSK